MYSLALCNYQRCATSQVVPFVVFFVIIVIVYVLSFFIFVSVVFLGNIALVENLYLSNVKVPSTRDMYYTKKNKREKHSVLDIILTAEDTKRVIRIRK